MDMVRNDCGQSGHGTLELTVSQEWTDEKTDFLHADTNSGKLNVDSRFLIGCGQNDHGFLVHETLKSAVS